MQSPRLPMGHGNVRKLIGRGGMIGSVIGDPVRGQRMQRRFHMRCLDVNSIEHVEAQSLEPPFKELLILISQIDIRQDGNDNGNDPQNKEDHDFGTGHRFGFVQLGNAFGNATIRHESGSPSTTFIWVHSIIIVTSFIVATTTAHAVLVLTITTTTTAAARVFSFLFVQSQIPTVMTGKGGQ